MSACSGVKIRINCCGKNIASAKKTKDMPRAYFIIVQNKFFTIVLSPFPQYWASSTPPAPITEPLNKFMTNAIWFANDTAETASCEKRPSIKASVAPINATKRLCRPIGIARANISL